MNEYKGGVLWNVMPLTNVEKYSDLEASVRWEMGWRGKWRRDEDMNRLIWTRISAPAALSRVSKDDAWWWDYPAVYAAGRVGPRLLRPGKVGGGIEASGGKSEIPISETRNGLKSDGQFFYYLFDVLQRHHWLGIVRVNDGWLVRRLAVYFFILPLLAHTFGSGCLYLW